MAEKENQNSPSSSRRNFVKNTTIAATGLYIFPHYALTGNSLANDSSQNPTSVYYDEKLKPFYHGVASGDPLQNAVIIWTRLTPEKSNGPYEVNWQMAQDAAFSQIIKKGKATTSAAQDFTIKADVTGLMPDTYYYYKFSWRGKDSVVGRTKTLPDSAEGPVRFITVSCNSYEGGYFNAYARIAARSEKIDAVLHLGDYIYEGFLEKYITKADRVPLPKKELVALNDYRIRYAQYRLDADLRNAHQMHPFIPIWDDHEIANDSYATGAQSHNAQEEGHYKLRVVNAKQAFYEWLPIRKAKHLYRKISLGSLADIFMLDERLEGRTEQKAVSDPEFNSENRAILGEKQFDWFVQNLTQSKAKWKIIGNQVVFSEFDFSPVIKNGAERKSDQWDGYPYERQKLISAFKANAIANLVFLSGDSHCSWAFEIPDKSNSAGSLNHNQPLAVEFGTPSISSGNWDDSAQPGDNVQEWEKRLLQLPANTHLKYANIREHGYLMLTLTQDRAQVAYYYINKDRRTNEERLANSFNVVANTNKISFG